MSILLDDWMQTRRRYILNWSTRSMGKLLRTWLVLKRMGKLSRDFLMNSVSFAGIFLQSIFRLFWWHCAVCGSMTCAVFANQGVCNWSMLPGWGGCDEDGEDILDTIPGLIALQRVVICQHAWGCRMAQVWIPESSKPWNWWWCNLCLKVRDLTKLLRYALGSLLLLHRMVGFLRFLDYI